MYQVYIEESEMVVEKAQHSPTEDSAAAAPPPKPGPVSPSRRRRHVTAETFIATRCPPRLFSSLKSATQVPTAQTFFSFSGGGLWGLAENNGRRAKNKGDFLLFSCGRSR
ncbi:hypothetical protein TIFTF001_054793 [Ficus carica]|uniref:Uncharacterized protein n=1 Tax=Ficus carica TaxID=3494 RepID=A0AA88EGK9_FICCA|nr:hypothetical protein TIFTF001_054793 [Ficus carica]